MGDRGVPRCRVTEAEFGLEAALAEQEAAEEFRNANARAARVVGRVSLYIETIHLVDERETLQKAVKQAQAEVDRVQALLGADEEQDFVLSILNRIGSSYPPPRRPRVPSPALSAEAVDHGFTTLIGSPARYARRFSAACARSFLRVTLEAQQ